MAVDQHGRLRDSFAVSRNFKDLRGGKFRCRSPDGLLRARRPVSLTSGVAVDSVRFRVPHLVGTRLPSHYHLRAGIQSFQALAAPFPSDSVCLQVPLAAGEPLRDDLPRPPDRQRLDTRDMRDREPVGQPLRNTKPPIRGLAAWRRERRLGWPAQALLCDAGSWKPWALPSSGGAEGR